MSSDAASTNALAIACEVDALCDRFEQALQRGEQVRIDDFLPAAGPVRAAALLQLVRIEIEYLRRAGEAAMTREYRARFPELPITLMRTEAPIVPPPTDPVAPVIPGYEIRGELGKGGMGVVYEAWEPALKRVVALKMILAGPFADEAEVARFRTEAESVASLKHPHIVQIHAIGECAGRPYIALEFCAGGSLARKLGGTPLPAKEAAALVETLARTIHAVHLQKIVHRDLKPANVLLTADSVLKITDFGLAKRLDVGGLTPTDAILGTPSYMAPEQAGRGKAKEVGPAADVYALGAILYECLTGRPPFKAATVLDTIMQVLHDDPVPPRQLQSKTPRDLETQSVNCS